MHGRYIDQFSQEEVARDLFLSPRQLRRLEQSAVEVLADSLWAAYHLEDRLHLFDEAPAAKEAPEAAGGPPPEAGPSGYNEELSWLEHTLSSQRVDCLELVQSALHTAQPLLDSLQTRVIIEVQESLPQLSIHLITARQALLHVITLAARRAGAGQVRIQAETLASQLYVRLSICVQPDSASGCAGSAGLEGLDVTHKLVHLSKGSFEITGSEKPDDSPLKINLTLPTAEQVPVLVIDDNIDTLHLVERYLSGTSYRFMGVSHPAGALEAAAQTTPGVIIMDVMLPDMDGWDLLGRLRAHPSTQHIPMIVCTILPQAQLALMLGAADFLSKPIRREALLSALDRLVGLAL